MPCRLHDRRPIGGTTICTPGSGTLLAICFWPHWALSLRCPFSGSFQRRFKPPEQLFRLPRIDANPFMWSNYAKATTFIPFFQYFGNTLYITIFNVIAILISCSLVAYGFARINWPGQAIALFMVLIFYLDDSSRR